MANIFREPLITKIERTSSHANLDSQFNVWKNPISSLYVGQDTFFDGFGKAPCYDWPNPVGHDIRSRSTPAITLKTWTHNNTGYLGKDTIYGTSGQVPDYDWPNPTLPRKGSISLYEWDSSGLLNLLTAITQSPFYQLDWPNPRGPQFPIDLRTYLNQLELNLIGQDSFFGLAGNPNFDWPVPKVKQPSIDLKTWIDQTKINLIGKDKFFGLAGNPTFDWPNPIGTNRNSIAWPSLQLRTHINPGGQLLLRGQDTFFGLAGNPNFDWPVPKGKEYASSLRVFLDPMKLLLIGQDRVYDGPGKVPTYDWQNPRGYIPGISLKTWIDNSKIHLIGKDIVYGTFGQVPDYDWPNPRGPQRGISLYSWDNSGLLNLLTGTFVQPPLNQYDWPNPLRLSQYRAYYDANSNLIILYGTTAGQIIILPNSGKFGILFDGNPDSGVMGLF